jgi:mannosyltransferase
MRLAFLGRQSLWYDEAFSLAVARADWPIFWAALLTDGVHPPGYYLALKAALALFGSSEFALRFMSVVAGTLAVPLMDRLGRALGGRRWGMAAALLLAINPFALWYAQEARMYSLLLCLIIAGGYAFRRLLARPGLGTWLGLCLISALSFLVHYFAFVFSLVQFVYLVITLRRTHRALRWWATAQALASVPFLAWGIAIATREGRNFGIGWIHPPTLLDLPLTLSNLALTLYDPTQLWAWAGLTLLLAAVVAGIAMGVKAGAFVPIWSSDSSGPGDRLLSTPYFYLLTWLVVPIIFTWLFSMRLPLYVDRFLIICLPAFVLLASTISLSSTWLARGTMILLVMASAITSTRLWFDLDLTKEDWRTAATYVQSREQPGDVLVMRDLQNRIPFGYYYRGKLNLQIAQINQDIQSLDDLSQGYRRLWLVYRRPFEPTHALAGSQPFSWQKDQEPAIQGWLVSHASGLAQETTFPGVYVLLYRLGPTETVKDGHN